MRYDNMVSGIFRERPNRFIAHVELGGQEEVCHVKNTGRCKELLIPGARVWCEVSRNPNRKTKYDLIAVEKGTRLINMDSQAPNAAAKEWLSSGGLGKITGLKPEFTHGDSRFDFYFEKDGKKCLMEVKGCTLEMNGVCAFPDAPTARGAKHLRGLIQAQKDGFACYVLIVIQMSGVEYFRPHHETDPDFAKALRDASDAGVQILAMDCAVTKDSMVIQNPVEVRLQETK